MGCKLEGGKEEKEKVEYFDISPINFGKNTAYWSNIVAKLLY